MKLSRSSLGDPFDSIFCYPELFTSDECRQIISFGENLPGARGTLTEKEMVNERLRKVWRAGFPLAEKLKWVTKKIMSAVDDANQFRYHLPVRLTQLDFLRYAEKEDHYDWHRDSDVTEKGDISLRRISIVVLLSSRSDHLGGDLEFKGIRSNFNREQGSVLVFPSICVHRVTPLVRGLRYTLAGWAQMVPT